MQIQKLHASSTAEKHHREELRLKYDDILSERDNLKSQLQIIQEEVGELGRTLKTKGDRLMAVEDEHQKCKSENDGTRSKEVDLWRALTSCEEELNQRNVPSRTSAADLAKKSPLLEMCIQEKQVSPLCRSHMLHPNVVLFCLSYGAFS